MIKKILHFMVLCTFFAQPIFSQTIAEKKAGLVSGGSDLNLELQTFLAQVNKELTDAQSELASLHVEVGELYAKNAPEENFKELLERINVLREQVLSLETSWRDLATKSNSDETYALWHQPDTSLGQLIIDYGSNNYVYLIPPEVADIKINVASNLPVPRCSWNEMLELILTQNGVGFKQLNPYLRQLFLLSDDISSLSLITNKRKDLEFMRPEARICFMLSPEPSEVRRTWAFLDKFVNPNTTILQMVGRDIIIVAQVAEVNDLLKLYDFVATNRGDKEFRIISLTRVKPEEMAKILSMVFDQFSVDFEGIDDERGNGDRGYRPRYDTFSENEGNGLKIIPLSNVAQSIFLVGTKEEIRKAEETIRQVESQVGDAREKTIFWYTAKHSDPIELANVLEKIYALMMENPDCLDQGANLPAIVPVPTPPSPAGELFTPNYGPKQPFPQKNIYDDGYYLNDRYLVDDSPLEIDRTNYANMNRKNFIVDLKTGAIVMVVEADVLPKMKDLLKKLDVPKKMVQIEVLLFEKRTCKENEFGLNLLRLGDLASNTNTTGLLFNNIMKSSECSGVTEFFLSRKKSDSGIPAFDAVYKFLLTQDDIQINANPSILTINQTAAKIAIEDEISVNTGVFEVETNKGVTLKDAFARARYGIKLEITPTIHIHDENNDDECDYITLVTDVVFETIHPRSKDRPDVTRRLINNEARVADGQTVILGGLRRKVTDDRKESIPFIGELPGIGKLFSITKLHDNSTEMFIFITPKIIHNPCDELICLRQQELSRRPGDIPSFLCSLEEAQRYDKNRLLQGSLTMLFGREPPCARCPVGEWDGR